MTVWRTLTAPARYSAVLRANRFGIVIKNIIREFVQAISVATHEFVTDFSAQKTCSCYLILWQVKQAVWFPVYLFTGRIKGHAIPCHQSTVGLK